MTKTGTAQSWIPTTCTLPIAEQPTRVAEFDTFFHTALRRATRIGPTQLDLTVIPGTEESARDLAIRDSGCCSFFHFSFTPDASGELVMDIRVTDQHVDVLDALHRRIASLSRAGDHHA